jgi:phosphoribosyl-ATP pyrophosphohydrolase
MADLLFHLLVAMERTRTPWEEVVGVLEKRTGKGGLEEKKERSRTAPKKGEAP